jgi:hypothetical protein
MANCNVLFEVGTEFLNITLTSFGFKGLTGSQKYCIVRNSVRLSDMGHGTTTICLEVRV